MDEQRFRVLQPSYLVLVWLIALASAQTYVPDRGDDPWYQKASYYWLFNTLKDPGIVDQRGTTSVQAYSKKGLQFDGLLGSWADLENFSYHCISDPDACKTGFTVTFWLRVNDRQSKRFVMQIASATLAVGTTVEIDNDILGVYVNSRATQRHVEVKWPYSSWIFVALTWNKTEGKIGVSLNCSSVPHKKDTVQHSYALSPVPPYHSLILGANNARLRSIKMTIDELAVWNGPLSQEDLCYIMESKAVDGKYTNWSDFSPCTVTCGVGTKTRTRTCTNPRPQHGGNNCQGHPTNTKFCRSHRCSQPVKGKVYLTEWSVFSPCTLTCGGGKQYRTRTCTRPIPQYGGHNCFGLGPKREEVDCNKNPCPIHGGYSEWSDFSACSVSCHRGTKTRTRMCNRPFPQHGGKDCSIFGPAKEARICSMRACSIDGNYSNWSVFSVCTKSCGVGQKIRTRKCANLFPVGEGGNCQEPLIDIQPCNTQACPINGGYTPWSDFSLCSKSCAGGTQLRTRDCTNPTPDAGGQDCSHLGPPEETVLCNKKPCPVDGGYGEWSLFTRCSVSCGGGESVWFRLCDNPFPQHGGRECLRLGPERESRACNTKQCPATITFITSVKFTKEKFSTEIFNTKSNDFKRLVDKIRYNVQKIYDENSALESIDFKWCGSTDGGPSVLCVLQFDFMADRYTGVIALQDALTMKQMLYSMPVKTHYISSNDVPSYAPENVMINNTSSRSINVTWNKIRPHTIMGGSILGYRVVYTDVKGSAWSLMVAGEENTQAELQHLEIYTLYCVRIMGYNRRGDGIASFPVCTYTDKDGSECYNYTVLSSADRAQGNTHYNARCDQRDLSMPGNWYRFMGAAGNQIPDACVPIRRCGTHAPGWFNGTHPTVQDGVVTRSVCYHWWSNCCFWNNTIKVKNCSGYYVYELQRTPTCPLRYCGNASAGNIDRVADVPTEEKQHKGLTVIREDARLSDWGQFTNCSVSCGSGFKIRYRTCNRSRFGGKNCSSLHGTLTEQQPCNVHNCSEDATLSDWSPFTNCSVSCGSGFKSRYRTCNRSRFGGKECSSFGALTERQPCNVLDCSGNADRVADVATEEKQLKGLTFMDIIIIIIVSAGGSVILILVTTLAVILFKKHRGRKPNVPDKEEITPYAVSLI